MKTFIPKNPGQDRKWVVVDAAGKPVGRLAVEIANLLRGRDKPTYSPQVDTGSFVVVINAGKVKLTGVKEEKKSYKWFSGFRGGLKTMSASEVRVRKPEYMIRHAVKGMLPRNLISRQIYRHLKVYEGAEHPHAAQQPQTVELL